VGWRGSAGRAPWGVARGGGAETGGLVFLLSSTGVRWEGRGLDNRGRMGIDLSRKWSSSAPPRLRVFGFFNQIWQRSDF
jgi:hypothetical protein